VSAYKRGKKKAQKAHHGVDGKRLRGKIMNKLPQSSATRVAFV
jgi:hypothetical protein